MEPVRLIQDVEDDRCACLHTPECLLSCLMSFQNFKYIGLSFEDLRGRCLERLICTNCIKHLFRLMQGQGKIKRPGDIVNITKGAGKNLEKGSLENGETKIDNEQCTRESPVKLSYSIEEDQLTEQQEPPFLRSVKQKISDNLMEAHDFDPVLVQETATLTEPSKDGILDLNLKQKDVEDSSSSPEKESIEEVQEKSQFDKTVEKQKTLRGEELGTGYEEDSDI